MFGGLPRAAQRWFDAVRMVVDETGSIASDVSILMCEMAGISSPDCFGGSVCFGRFGRQVVGYPAPSASPAPRSRH